MAITLDGTDGVTTTGLTSNGIDDNATSTAVTIDSSGNVGIGGAPVNSTRRLMITDTSDCRVDIRSGSDTNLGAVDFSDTSNTARGQIIYDHSNDSLQVKTLSTERMRIDSSGNVLVGTTVLTDIDSSGSGNEGAVLKPDGQVDLATSNAPSLRINRKTFVGSFINLRYNGSTVGSISTNGSSTSYNTSSDYRLKENVVDLDNATDRLKQIPVHRFNFLADADTTVDGFLAHEVQAVVPEAITGSKDKVDDEGNPVYQGIDQSKLVPLLVATVKELEARIAALEAN